MAAAVPLVRGKRVRLTRLDACGDLLPAGTPDAVVTTSGFISVGMAPEYVDGDEFEVKNANGDLCVNERDDDELKRIVSSISLCGVDFSVLELMTAAPIEVDDDGKPVGNRTRAQKNTARFALELWTGVAGSDACAAGAVQYGYFVMPFLGGGRLTEQTVENGVLDVSIENALTRGGGGWGVGPWNVIEASGSPSPLLVALSSLDHRLARLTTVAPPPPTDGFVPMYSGDGDDLSAGYAGAAALADLATLQADGTYGDTGTAAPYNGGTGTDAAFATGYSTTLGDASQAYWSGSGWLAGVAP